MEPNAVILKNRGVSLRMAATEADGDSFRAKILDDATGEPVVENVWVRFTANEVADIEETFGSIDKFQTSMSEKPTSTVRTAIAIATGRAPRDVGAAMLPDETAQYMLSVQIAWAVAMGMDPTQAVRTLDEGCKAIRDEADAARERIDKELKAASVVGQAESILEDHSPGGNGSAPGSRPEEIPNSSGA